ncbi:MAG: BON domain-containing protein [Xanthomonadales bacterium]|nr:BON domain-containing protein [Xanthomonadales bacterium]
MKKIILTSLLSTTIILTSCTPVVVGGAIVTGISVANDRRSAGQVIDDKIISAQIRREIHQNINNDKHIKVMTYNGVVLIAGEAETNKDRIKAEDIAASINGVVKVVNELHDTIPTNLKRRTKDSYITSKAKSSLIKIDLDGFNPTRVKIMTVRGHVYLMGKVSSQESEAVVEKIRNLRGVRKVIKVFEYLD